ncbi:Glycerophosphoryl diester phosphodiesterase [Pseudoalteromonas luteoviolacea B = ATCC 29581]|nr:Glycerophosphoryl diester phosphodiesterase [Pseudoalteromonas luteoviolacea B = ATCC 29581]
MKVFAHRGASGNYPENTLAAIKAAITCHADGIELDIQECKDDFVVLHDTWLERTTSGVGQVAQFSVSQLKQLNAGSGERIPTLQEVFDYVPTHTQLNLELKSVINLDKLIALLDKNLNDKRITQKQLLISSFNHPLLKQIKQHFPWLNIGALTASLPLDYARFASELSAFSVHVDREFVDQAFVDDAKSKGLKVYAYTVDKQQDIERLQQMGIDGIFSNYPCKAKMFLTT